MENTDNAVGENTSTRTAIIYKATHPSLEGVYVGCRLDNLDDYYTSSDCFDEAVALTGIKPTLEAIDVLKVDWSVEENRQVPYQKEKEVYDLLKGMGATLLNGKTPSGYCCFVTNVHQNKVFNALLGRLLSEETRAKISIALQGRQFSDEHLDNLSKARKLWKHTEIAKKTMSKAHTGKTLPDETKKKMSEAQKGKTKASNRKVVSSLDGRVTSAACAGRWDKKNPAYIGTWVDL
jgi:hypothetical protein